ncbi:MAG: Gfo/Idh/MocA family oxidoreductase [Sphingomonas bacterium]
MLPIAIIGFGKIAQDQHVPALRADSRFQLAATVDPNSELEGVAHYPDVAALVAADIGVKAVAICTPPSVRHTMARAAIAAGLHVLLEKPPGETVDEVIELERLADEAGVTLFTAWHSREAAAVDSARDWLSGRAIDAVRIAWKEDIRVWHPGQEWILEAGGFGVFDPGINALSVLTDILPEAPVLVSAKLLVPRGRASPIIATLEMRSGTAPISVDFDFLYEGEQRWDIEVDTPDGMLLLRHGGATLSIADVPVPSSPNREYPRLYARFGELIAAGESDVDLSPLQLVTEAMAIGEHIETEPFAFERGIA